MTAEYNGYYGIGIITPSFLFYSNKLNIKVIPDDAPSVNIISSIDGLLDVPSLL